jgi:hypothetical protein
MHNNKIYLLAFCAFFFCAATCYGQYDTCAHLKEWEALNPDNEIEAQMQYDTLRLYIEKCAEAECNAALAFGSLDGANQFRSADTNRYYQYRSWLIKVLYLNTSCVDYFCTVMGAITTTYQKMVQILAVYNYLRTYHKECWSSAADKDYSKDSVSAFHQGQDPTHLPSLESLGLGFLMKTVTPSGEGTQFISSFSSSPNPFIKNTTLHFALNGQSYISIEIYDLLGNKVYGNARKSYEPGSYEISLHGKDLPHGTLYARISTGFGEVKTVKLIHQ